MEPRSGSASIVVAQVYYPYYLPPAVAHFPHGGLNDEQTLQTNVAPYFSNGATKNNTQSCKPLQLFQHQYQRHRLSRRRLVKTGVRSQNGVTQIHTKKKRHANHKKRLKCEKISDKVLVLKYDNIWRGEWHLPLMQQCLEKKKRIKILHTSFFFWKRLGDRFIQYLMEELLQKKKWVRSASWVMPSQSHTTLDNCALRRK